MTTARKALWGVALALLGGLAGCATPARIMADVELNELCAKDAGIHVYERVALPSKYFYPEVKGSPVAGEIDLAALERDKGQLGRNFELIHHSSRFKSRSGVDMQKVSYRLIEHPSGKLLADGLNYTRIGGDLGNPFTPTVQSCRSGNEPFGSAFLAAVFSKEEL